MLSVKNPVLPHGASSKEKTIQVWTVSVRISIVIYPRPSGWVRSSERGILAFSRKVIGPPAVVV